MDRIQKFGPMGWFGVLGALTFTIWLGIVGVYPDQFAAAGILAAVSVTLLLLEKRRLEKDEKGGGSGRS